MFLIIYLTIFKYFIESIQGDKDVEELDPLEKLINGEIHFNFLQC